MPAGAFGYYLIARLDGRDVAGLGPAAAPPDPTRQSTSQTMPAGGVSPSSSIGSCLSMWPISPL
jgi:hypothetical protein